MDPTLTTSGEWESYLREYSLVYLRTANEYQRAKLNPEHEAAHWMGRDPASEAAVAAVEQRLSITFPASYRSFLLATDGWDGVGGWIDLVYPCERIGWMRDTWGGKDLIGLYTENPGEDDGPNTEYVTVFTQSLEVASGEDFWLLDPTVTGSDDEWAAYLFEPKYGTLERFASFAELFRDSRHLME